MSCGLKENLKFSHKNFSHFSLFHLDPFYSFFFPSIFWNILKKFSQQFSFHFHFLGQQKEHWLFNVLFLELFGAWKIYRLTLSLLLISIILWFFFVHCLTHFSGKARFVNSFSCSLLTVSLVGEDTQKVDLSFPNENWNSNWVIYLLEFLRFLELNEKFLKFKSQKRKFDEKFLHNVIDQFNSIFK